MNPGQKPEWIELADSDTPIKHHKIIKGLPILAVVVTTAIIGAGAIFAQPQELSVANADPIVATSTQNADQLAPVVPSTADAEPAAVNEEPAKVPNVSSENSAANLSGVSTSTTNPSIETLPTKSGDDEADDEAGDEGNDD